MSLRLCVIIWTISASLAVNVRSPEDVSERFHMTKANSHEINYFLHQTNGQSVNDCMNEAIAQIERETCLTFQENPQAHNAILFLDSDRCGFQDSNATIHVGSNCMTRDSCMQFLQHAITGDKKHHSAAIRHLNLKFNCTAKCTRDCGVGGVVQPDCTCRCRYGFVGENCEQLKLAAQFTDANCGFINAAEQPSAVIALSNGKTETDTFCQWVLKSDDPFHTFRLEVEELDLDDENVPPGQKCGDTLYLYGLEDHIENPVPCVSGDFEEDAPAASVDGTQTARDLVGKTLRSKSNVVIIEYRGNRLPSRPHKGPVFRYMVTRQQPFHNEIPSLKYEHVTAGTTSAVVSQIAALVATAVITLFGLH